MLANLVVPNISYGGVRGHSLSFIMSLWPFVSCTVWFSYAEPVGFSFCQWWRLWDQCAAVTTGLLILLSSSRCLHCYSVAVRWNMPLLWAYVTVFWNIYTYSAFVDYKKMNQMAVQHVTPICSWQLSGTILLCCYSGKCIHKVILWQSILCCYCLGSIGLWTYLLVYLNM